MMQKKIAIVLFAGFLGAGKTTLLKRLLPMLTKGRKVALLVNDFGQLSLDGALLKRCNVPTLEIAGGSIFCVCKQANLVAQLSDIANNIVPDLLLIEASGLAEPTDTAALLQSTYLRDVYALPQVITVVDALNYPKLSPILPVLAMQVKIADILIISKIDLADTSELQQELKTLNSSAEIICSDAKTIYGEINLKPICNCSAEAPMRLCSTMTPGFSILNWQGSVDIEKFSELLTRYAPYLLRAKGVVDNAHLELVNGSFNWSSDTSGLPQGVFFAFKDNKEREFIKQLKEIEK